MQGVVGPCPKCKVVIQAPAIFSELPPRPEPTEMPAPEKAGDGATPVESAASPRKEVPPIPADREVGRKKPVRPAGAVVDERPARPKPSARPVEQRAVRRIESAEQAAPETPEPEEEKAGEDSRRWEGRSRRWVIAFGIPLAFLLACAALLVALVFLLGPRMREDAESGSQPVAGQSSESGSQPAAEPVGDSSGGAENGAAAGEIPGGKTDPGTGGASGDGQAAALPPETDEPVSLAARAEAALNRFLLSGSLEERMPAMFTRRSPEELARTSLAGLLPQPVTPLLEKRTDTPDESLIEFFYRVEFPDAVAPHPRFVTVGVRQPGDGAGQPKVLADPFIDMFDGGVVAFAGKPDAGEMRSFHVLIEAIPICEDLGVPDPGGKITMQLRASPKGEALANAYVDKDSMVAQMLAPPRPSLHWGKPTPCVVSIRWNLDAPGKPFLELVKIDSFTWTR